MVKRLLLSTLVLKAITVFGTTNLPPIIVEATRVGSESVDVPASIQIFTDETIKESSALCLPDFLENEASLPIRHMNANPLQSSVALRGFGENSFGRVLVLVDGERLNNADMEPPNLLRLAFDSVSRIEVMRGPQTVLYGDSASAGVINILTETFSDKPAISFRGNIGSYDRVGSGLSLRYPIWDGIGTIAAGISAEQSDGYRDHSKYRLLNGQASLFLLSKDEALSGKLSAFFSRGFYEMPGALTEMQYRNSPREAKDGAATDDDADFITYGLASSFEYLDLAGNEHHLQVNGSAKCRDVDWRGASPSRLDFDATAVGISYHYLRYHEMLGNEGFFTIGIDSTYDDCNSETKADYGNSSSDYKRYSTAAFVQGALGLTESLSIVAGSRAERMWSEWSGTSQLRSIWNEWAWDIAINWNAAENLRAFARTSRFFRAPFCDEMNFVASGDKLIPESGYSFDLGLEARFFEEMSFDVTLYAMQIDDEIFYNPYADSSFGYWLGYNENSPAVTERLGGDLSLKWERKRVAKLAISYSCVEATFREGSYDGKDIPLVPLQSLALRGEVWFLGDFAFGAGARFVDKQRFGGDYYNEHGSLPGYGTVDCSIKYQPERKDDKNLTISLSVENLFDKSYSDYAGWSDFSGRYYYPAEGRHFLLAVKYDL